MLLLLCLIYNSGICSNVTQKHSSLRVQRLLWSICCKKQLTDSTSGCHMEWYTCYYINMYVFVFACRRPPSVANVYYGVYWQRITAATAKRQPRAAYGSVATSWATLATRDSLPHLHVHTYICKWCIFHSSYTSLSTCRYQPQLIRVPIAHFADWSISLCYQINKRIKFDVNRRHSRRC